jgi:hypothetical protein
MFVNIDKKLLTDLFSKYQFSLGIPEPIVVDESLFAKACQFIENHHPGYFDWDVESLPGSKVNDELLEILKECLIIEDNKVLFNQRAGYKALLHIELQKLHLERKLDETGIQEKYLKSHLTGHEPLTNLDVKRFINQSKMGDSVYVCTLDAMTDLLENEVLAQEKNHNPYTVAMMVNCGSANKPEWISLLVTLNPLSHEVEYKINLENAAQKDVLNQKIKQQINTAISGISSLQGFVNLHPNVGGYRVLHALYQDELIRPQVEKSKDALDFSKVDPSIQAIKKSVYTTQLRSIVLSEEERTMLGRVKTVEEELAALERQLDLLASAPASTSGLHPFIAEKMAVLTIFQTTITFPDRIPNPPMSTEDYQQFLGLLQDKFDRTDLNILPQQMVFNCYDHHVLGGIGAYCEQNMALPFDKLTLDLNQIDLTNKGLREEFLFELKTLMLTLSSTKLSELKLSSLPDKEGIQAVYEELVAFAKSRAIALDVNLPEPFNQQKMQRELDEAVSDNIREKNWALFNKNRDAKSTETPVSDKIRTRPKAKAKQAAAIDIELQQEQQQQQQQQVEVVVEETDKKTPLPAGDLVKIYDLTLFKRALKKNELNKGYLIPDSEAEELWKNWVGAVSIVRQYSHGGSSSVDDVDNCVSISKIACQELIRNKDKFQYGLDLKNLPAGFVRKAGYVHFDKNLKLVSEYNPLKVQLNELPGTRALSTSQFNTWLHSNPAHPAKLAWDKLSASPVYDKKAFEAFKQFLPQMLLLEPDKLELLFELCISSDPAYGNRLETQRFQTLLSENMQLSKDPDADYTLGGLFDVSQRPKVLEFILNYKEQQPAFKEHLLYQSIAEQPELIERIQQLINQVPDLNLNALLQLYLSAGEEGINQLIAQVNSNPDFFNTLHQQVFSHYKNYAALLQEDFKEAIRSINGFTFNENVWWETLLTQHCQAQKNVNLVDLVNAFKGFKQKLSELSTEGGYPLDLPVSCSLSNTKSLPVTLSRILSLLEHVPPENRLAQWNVIQGLDFSSSGAIKAISTYDPSGRRWAFITPEMKISAETEEPLYYEKANYKYCTDPDDLNIMYESQSDNAAAVLFRCSSYQDKDGQLPLDFYFYVHALIKEKQFSSKIQLLLCRLISGSTSGDNRQTIKSLDEAKEYVKSIIDLAKETTWPDIKLEGVFSIREVITEHFLSGINTFSPNPPLPVFHRLFHLCMNSAKFQSLGKMKKSIEKLQKNLDDFQIALISHGPVVYEGMSAYNLKGDVFYRYVNTLKSLELSFVPIKQYSSSVIRLISLFQLQETQDHSHLADIFKKYASDTDEVRLKEVLNLLFHISLPDQSRKLNVKDLEYILNTVGSKPDKPVVELIKNLKLPDNQNLAVYFPDKFLENYGKEGVPKPILTLISENFLGKQEQEQIKELLLHFRQPLDPSHYEDVVDQLIQICKPLTVAEKNIFIAKLASAPGLYTDKRGLDNNDFVALLEVIKTKNSVNDFMIFMSGFEHELDQEGLVSKAVIYLKKLVPNIKSIEGLTLAQTDWMPRAIEILFKTSDTEIKTPQYANSFVALFQKMNKVAVKNPGSSQQFLQLYDVYLQHYQAETHGELIPYLTRFVSILETVFSRIPDKTMVLSLCLQFKDEQDVALQPEGLLKLLEIVSTVPEEHQGILLKIAVALINNEKEYSLESMKKLAEAVTKAPKLTSELITFYQKAPYPTIEQILEWHQDVGAEGNYAAQMHTKYTQYSIKPCHREDVNGFHADKALQQYTQFLFNGKKTTEEDFSQSKEYFEFFEGLTQEMQRKSPAELLELLHSFKDKNPAEVDYDTLIAVAAELLHRSKGNDEKNPEGSFALGSSMEINTTQYLALLTMFKVPGAITSQIGTGEGKTRIMMIATACQFALGNTVDFVTSDAQLATRDYVEFQSYFNMIGAETSLVFPQSSPTQYKIGGINFSDPTSLSLFRNKGRSMGMEDKVLDSRKNHRAILLDEADKAYFDMAGTRFNFSMRADESLSDMEWVYPLLIDYFAQSTILDKNNLTTPLELYYSDVDLSREKFLDFARVNCNKTQLLRLMALSNAQIEQWQVSAFTATQLKFKEDFDIQPDGLIRIETGSKMASSAQVRFANRVSKSSQFSFGVHQCLHARLNAIRERKVQETDTQLKQAVGQCQYSFYIPEEKQIVYSTTSKNLLDDYQEGTLKAVTGTSGSNLERAEARELYGKIGQKMQFVDVPRDQGLKRHDRAVLLTRNHKQQVKALIKEIRKAREKEQPILLVAENDKESLELFTLLNTVFPDEINHVHSQTPIKEELACIQKAGLPGQITISTDMIGRGTDISLKGEAKIHGLKVLTTYLPTVRDLGQIIGRSGRFGANGDAVMILDKKRLKATLGKKSLTNEGYYRNVETYIKREQGIMDRNKQSERLIKNTVGDFRKQLTDNFFKDLLEELDIAKYQSTVLPIWSGFFDKSDKEWNETWPRIQELLIQDKVDVAQVDGLLKEYETKVQELWNALRANIQSAELVCADGKKPGDLLDKKVTPLALNERTKNLLTSFNLDQFSLRKDRVIYKQYEKGHAGMAVVYQHWYTLPLASLKGFLNLIPGVHLENARPVFADFRAWREGHGRVFPTLMAIFADLRDYFKQKKTKPETPPPEEESKQELSYHLFVRHGIAQKNKGSEGEPVKSTQTHVELPELSIDPSEEYSEEDKHPSNKSMKP